MENMWRLNSPNEKKNYIKEWRTKITANSTWSQAIATQTNMVKGLEFSYEWERMEKINWIIKSSRVELKIQKAVINYGGVGSIIGC